MGHRVSAWALRMSVHRVVAGTTRNARIGRKCRERSREGNNPSQRWRDLTNVCGDFGAWTCRRKAAHFFCQDASITPKLRLLNR